MKRLNLCPIFLFLFLFLTNVQAETETQSPVFYTFIGPALHRYEQTGIPNFNSTTLQFKARLISRPILSYFDIRLNAQSDFLTLSDSPQTNVTFIRADAELGIKVPFIHDPWKLSFVVGTSFNTMIVSKGAFGYNHLFFYSFSPTLRYQFRGGSKILLYLKLVPLSPGNGLSLKQRELSVGTSLEIPISQKKSIILALDCSDLSFDYSPISINSRTYSFNFGLGW